MRRSFFQRMPFIRISGLFIPGVVAAHYLAPGMALLVPALVALFLVHFSLWRTSNFSKLRIQNILLSLTIFLLGLFYSGILGEREPPEFQQKDYFLARVTQKPAEKAHSYQAVLTLQNKKITYPEKVVAYFDKSGFDSTLATGDRLIIFGKPQPIKNSGNPYEFDYQRMMQRRNICYSVYLPASAYLKTASGDTLRGDWAEKTRDFLVAKLSKVLPNREERSVVLSIALGYRAELDPETRDYFASTGAQHVLSVSGLHVGLLFLILSFFLGFLKRNKAGRVLFCLLVVLALWLYAFISGFSPSVQRATVMFTFIAVGQSIGRPVNIYNSLTASALLLVLINPEVIFEPGFQLSYLAVFGIVLIQPALFRLLNLENKALKGLWALFTVGVAAQITTFPLGIYYFNQFPNLFWLSNFIVIPVTSLLMWTSLAFFILLPFPALAAWAGVAIQKLCWFMLSALKLLSAYPLAVTHGLVFSVAQVFLIFGFIFSMVIYFAAKRKVWLLAGLALLIGFQVDALYEKYRLLNQKFVLVYNSKSAPVHLVNGRSSYLLVSGDELSDADQKMIQKVVDQRKLKNPIVLKRNETQNFKRPDLYLNANALQFLNCRVEFKPKTGYQKREELILVQGSPRGAPPVRTIISTGYLPLSGKPKADFYIRTTGAYWLPLE